MVNLVMYFKMTVPVVCDKRLVKSLVYFSGTGYLEV